MRSALLLLLLSVSAHGSAPELLEPATLLSKPSPTFPAPHFDWTGDFDADGTVDRVAGAYHGVTISWSERDGSRTERSYPAELASILGAGDLDGDGAADLLLSYGPTRAEQQVEVWYGRKGARRFAHYPTAIDADDGRFVLADLNRDGTADIVSDHRGAVSVIVSRRSRELDPPQLYFTGRDAIDLAVSDVDRDGHADVAFRPRNTYVDDVVQWLPGKGDGTFRSAAGVDLCAVVPCKPDRGRREEIMDVTGDGTPDYVILTPDRLVVLPVHAGGHPGQAVDTRLRPGAAHVPQKLVPVGDVSGDGRGDAVVFLRTIGGGPGRWAILHGRIDARFELAQVIDGMVTEPLPGARDLTGDGRDDLFSRGGEVVPGTTLGLFGTPYPAGRDDWRIREWATGHLVRFTDLDGDGITDIVSRDDWKEWHILLGSRDGTFRVGGGAPWSPALPVIDFLPVDVTGDAIPDVVALVPLHEMNPQTGSSYVVGHHVAVHRGRGDGTFDEPQVALSLSWIVDGFAAADHDGDGDIDLYASARVYLGRGDGSFEGGPGVRGDLAAVANGHVFVRRNHVHALLTEAPPRPRLAVGLTVQPENDYKPMLRAEVTGTGAGLATGAVRFELGEEVTVVQLVEGQADLEGWPFRHGATPVTATYSGDENFAPAAAATEYHWPRRATRLTVQALTVEGRPAREVRAGTPVRIVAAVSTRDGHEPRPSGGTLTLQAGGTTWQIDGTTADVLLDPALLKPGWNWVSVDWSGSGPFNEASASTDVVVRDTAGTKRRVVR